MRNCDRCMTKNSEWDAININQKKKLSFCRECFRLGIFPRENVEIENEILKETLVRIRNERNKYFQSLLFIRDALERKKSQLALDKVKEIISL